MICIKPYLQTLTEVSQFAPSGLKKIEKAFSKMKKCKNAKERAPFEQIIIKELKKITGISEIIFYTMRSEFNAFVLPCYSPTTLKTFWESFLSQFDEKEKKIPPKSLAQLKKFEEKNEFVEGFYVCFGLPLLKNLNSREITAVLLHELGHVQIASTSTVRIIRRLAQSLIQFITAPISIYMRRVAEMSANVVWLFLLINLSIVHITRFLDRKEEYRADNYALKYGYGDDLITAFSKMKSIIDEQRSKMNFFSRNFIIPLMKLLVIILGGTTHPSFEKRIKSLEKQIFTTFKNVYPQYKDLYTAVQESYKYEKLQEVKKK